VEGEPEYGDAHRIGWRRLASGSSGSVIVFRLLARHVLEEHQPFTVRTAFRVWIGRTKS